MKNRIRHIAVLLLLLALTLSACAQEEPTATPPPPTNTPVPPTATPIPPTDTPTPVPPTDTPVPPTDTPVPPTPIPEPTPAMELGNAYTDAAAGITLDLPEGWAGTSFFGITFIGESQEAMDAIINGETPEVAVVLFAGAFEDMGIEPGEIENPADVFDMEGVGPFDEGEEALSAGWEMGEIDEITIDGYPAAAAEFTSDPGTEDAMHGYAVIVVMEDVQRVAVFVGGTQPARWEEMEPTIKAIAHSMTFSEPQAATAFPEGVELADEPFESETNGFRISYPAGWQSMDLSALMGAEEGFATIFLADMATLASGTPTAVIVMADTVEEFLDGALVGVSKDMLGTIMATAAGSMGDLEMGEVEDLVVDDLPAVGAQLAGASDDGTPMSGYVVLALSDTHAAIIMAVTSADGWEALEPAFFAMLDTFVFTGTGGEAQGPTGPAATAGVGASRANPVPLGETASAAQWDIQIMEVLRGDEAWDAALAASEWNDPPAEGFEYVLVRIAAERTGASEAKEIGVVDFDITGAEAAVYEIPWLTNPEPELDAELLPGGTTEGWLSFTVREGETDLILIYDEAWEWDDRPIHFALEEGASVVVPEDLSSDGDATAGTTRAEPAAFGTLMKEGSWEFQVQDILWGDDAYNTLMEADSYNDPPAEGNEYLLLQVYARNLSPAEEPQEIDGSLFHVTGDNNMLYRYPYVFEPPPTMDAYLYPGGEWTGWLAYEIGAGETNPLLVFGPVYDLDEMSRFVALEEGAAVAFPASIDVTGDTALGTSPDDPAPAGTVIASEQWEFTILEVLRGDEAWDAVYEANEYNDEPEEGMEYVLIHAHVRNISSEDVPVLADYDLFDIVGENNEVYDKVYLTLPEPELDAWLYPNGEAEGWVSLQAAKDEAGLTLILSDSYFTEEKRYLSLEE